MSDSHHPRLVAEQLEALKLKNTGLTFPEIARQMGLTLSSAKRRVAAAKKRERLDPELARRLSETGVHDLAGLHSGWLLQKDEHGSGSSLYFYLGPDHERIDFAEAIEGVLSEIPKLEPIKPPYNLQLDLCNVIAVADLHVGARYGDPEFIDIFKAAVDDVVSRLPPAQEAKLIELGDLLDANDHKGLTPGSGNYCEVRPEDYLGNVQVAVDLMRYLMMRLAESHAVVDVDILRGNHDETAYVAVMLALAEHFKDVEQVTVNVTDDEYRVIEWGKCAIFPHHGDKAKWTDLKDVFADQFPDEWATAKSWRAIWTAHFHHDRVRDLLGVSCRHFRTLSGPSKWARQMGFFSRGTLTAVTLHKTGGPIHETMHNLLPWRKGKKQKQAA